MLSFTLIDSGVDVANDYDVCLLVCVDSVNSAVLCYHRAVVSNKKTVVVVVVS